MLKPEKGLLTFDAEGNNLKSSKFYSRRIHWPGIESTCSRNASGVTIGRGFDLGNRSKINALLFLKKAGIAKEKAEIISEGARLKGCAAYDFVLKNREKAGEITESQQLSLFDISYQELENDVKRICQKRSVITQYHPNPKISANDAWNNIPDKIKDVLIDMRYRGDYGVHARELLQHAAYGADLNGFGKILSNHSLWPQVPRDRFNRRVEFYENN
ncbi:pesticin C-terminus-like muramidase [Erwinia mallotivora]|uniref:pesticin C-terminus-like muramidase n=1 Tax=Erwinia mallotivora TaxID=69222 RepID=UPI0021C0F39C|nr:pesticin C-terminus-like muramidase [Erwinia mallotivora]